MKLHIKNMVCNRCIEAVQEELQKLSITYTNIILGEIELTRSLPDDTKSTLSGNLERRGFEMLEDKNSKIIQKIKALVIDNIRHSKEPSTNYSIYLESELSIDYSKLSSIFSSVEGVTIERYIILQRLERVRELLVYDELTLSEIAYLTGYSSVHHLSNQFKKNIGMSPTLFKKLHKPDRKPLDEV
ncbi:MAG: AraC family transcriptional regulator [Bacteroidota bacterium]